MKAHLINTHLLVPRSRSSAKVKVKYQGHVSQDGCVGGISVSQTHHVFDRITLYHTVPTFNTPEEGAMEKMLVTTMFPLPPHWETMKSQDQTVN